MPTLPEQGREPGWTKGALHVAQEPKWPFELAIVTADGDVVDSFSRFAISSGMKSVDDCVLGVGFSGEDFTEARDGNRRQLANLTLWASAPELYEALAAAHPHLETLHSLVLGTEAGTVVFRDILRLRAALAKATAQ